MLTFLVAATIVVVVVMVVVKLLPLLLIIMMISTFPLFVVYMPLLVVGLMTHSYAFGPTIGTDCSIYCVCVGFNSYLRIKKSSITTLRSGS